MPDITSALIGGGFTLAGIYLKHLLEVRHKAAMERLTTGAPAQAQPGASLPVIPESRPPSIPIPDTARQTQPQKKPRATSRILKGGLVLLADLIIMVIVVVNFNLNETEPPWEGAFAFLVLGAIPVYGLYLFFSGISRAIRRKA